MTPPSVVVVGAGAFGASTAGALARRGWDVTLVDQHAPANARGSSGDRTRLLRVGHGEWSDEQAAWYTRSAQRGIAGWQALAAEAGLDLVQRTGLVWLEAEGGDGAAARTADRLDALGVAVQRLGLDDAARRFPDLRTDDLGAALLEPEAFVIRASAAVEAMVARARRDGARLVLDRAEPAGPGEVRLATHGEVLGADHIVWACGPWLGRLFPDEVPVRAAWQEVLHWDSPPAWRDCPAFFDETAEVYGFPDVDGLGFKAVTHRPGRTFDVERDARMPTTGGVAAIAAYVAHRFPALHDAGLLWARVMPYELTPDSHFVLAASRDDARRWYLGGGSGHGFKHAPALGELLADCLEGRATPEPMHAAGPRGAPA